MLLVIKGFKLCLPRKSQEVSQYENMKCHNLRQKKAIRHHEEETHNKITMALKQSALFLSKIIAKVDRTLKHTPQNSLTGKAVFVRYKL